jgi:CHAT domain-containing protein
LFQKGQNYFGCLKSNLNPKVKHLYVLPNKELSFLPLEVTRISYEDKNKKPTVGYLVERYSTAYVYNFDQILKNGVDKVQKVETISVLDNTVDSNGKVLFPFSHEEATAVHNRYSLPFRSTLCNKHAFTKACGDGNTVVQVYSHAAADPNNLFKSFILLGKDSLNLNDILRINFKTPLLSLMACEVDFGEYDVNLGKVTLAPYFLNGGVHCVIASQWLVDDKVSALISEKFYHYLFQGNSAAASLRAAKLDILREYPSLASPLYWGAFRVLGTNLHLQKSYSSFQWLCIVGVLLCLSIWIFFLIRTFLRVRREHSM